MTQRNSMIPSYSMILAILWSQLFDEPQLFDDSKLFGDQLEVWTLIIQKCTVKPPSLMVLFCTSTSVSFFGHPVFLCFGSEKKCAIKVYICHNWLMWKICHSVVICSEINMKWWGQIKWKAHSWDRDHLQVHSCHRAAQQKAIQLSLRWPETLSRGQVVLLKKGRSCPEIRHNNEPNYPQLLEFYI